MNDHLLQYYLGQVSEKQRLHIENELLNSSEKLMEFIAIKRVHECLKAPLDPAPELKARSRALVEARQHQKRGWNWWFLAPVPALLAAFLFWSTPSPEEMSMAKTSPPLKTLKTMSVDSANTVAVNLSYL